MTFKMKGMHHGEGTGSAFPKNGKFKKWWEGAKTKVKESFPGQVVSVIKKKYSELPGNVRKKLRGEQTTSID